MYIPGIMMHTYIYIYIADWASTGMVANPARDELNREKHFSKFGLTRQVWPSRSASAHSFSTLSC